MVGGLAVAALCAACAPGAAFADSWTAGPDSAQVHPYGVSEELPGGAVLVAGGDHTNAPEGELLAADASGFGAAGNMTQERFYAAATLLADGRVLVAGGDPSLSQATPVPATAEVWSGAGGGSFTATGAMGVPRQALTLTTLPNGQAVAVGGSPDVMNTAGSPTAELYDPATNRWAPTGSMPAGRLGHTATLLPDCRVLIVGDNPTAVTYDYVTGAFSPAGGEGAFQRSYHTATLLASGRVLIAGGVDVGGTPLATASVYDPATGTFTPTANAMSVAHSQGFAARLSDGRVIVGGGFSSPGTVTSSVDVYNPASNSWSAAASQPGSAMAVSAEAQTLTDGDIAVMGIGHFGNSSEIYTPSSLGPTVAPPAENCSDLTSGGGGSGGGSSTVGSGGSPSSSGGGSAVGGQPTTLTIGRVKVAAGGRIEIAVTAPAAGSLTATATVPGKGLRGKRRAARVQYGSASVRVSRAGTLTLSIAPGRRAKTLLKSGRALRVTVTIFYRPANAAASARTVTVTVRGLRGRRSKR